MGRRVSDQASDCIIGTSNRGSVHFRSSAAVWPTDHRIDRGGVPRRCPRGLPSIYICDGKTDGRFGGRKWAEKRAKNRHLVQSDFWTDLSQTAQNRLTQFRPKKRAWEWAQKRGVPVGRKTELTGAQKRGVPVDSKNGAHRGAHRHLGNPTAELTDRWLTAPD